MLRPTHISARRLLHHAQSRDGPAPLAWSPWACTAGPCPQGNPAADTRARLHASRGHPARARAARPSPSQLYISWRGASRCRCTTTAQSHDKLLEARPTPSPSTRAIAKPLEPGPRQAPRSGSSPSPSNRANGKHLDQPLRIAHLPRREQPSNQAGPGTPQPSFAALRQGMRMGSDSPERLDFGPAYHSREGRVIKGRSSISLLGGTVKWLWNFFPA